MPPSALYSSPAKGVDAYTPVATISTSVGSDEPSRLIVFVVPSATDSTFFILAFVTIFTPFFSDNFCKTVPT
jgi:hypothetical protein